MTDILDLIDGTLEDYEVSDDAMRWSPDSSNISDTRTITQRLDEDLHLRASQLSLASAGFCVPENQDESEEDAADVRDSIAALEEEGESIPAEQVWAMFELKVGRGLMSGEKGWNERGRQWWKRAVEEELNDVAGEPSRRERRRRLRARRKDQKRRKRG